MQHDIPRTISEICKLVNFKEMSRTVRLKNTYHYLLELDNGDIIYRLTYSTSTDILKIRTEERFHVETTFLRHETVLFDFKERQVEKLFRESFKKSDYAKCIYPIVIEEDEHFQEMFNHNKYYPSLEDINFFLELKEKVIYDIVNWDNELLEKHKERIRSAPDYVKFRYTKRKK